MRRIFELKYREKLFNSLMQNSDTIYIMFDNTNKKVTYMTENIKDVLDIDGIKGKDDALKLINDIMSNPIIKEEMRRWDEKSEFVSQMISYSYNKGEQAPKRIRVKVYPLKKKKVSYQIISIQDATKEHSQQHKLIIQAKDIKAREKQLNEITATSYDFEININMITKRYSLKNYKKGVKYFGEESTGNYNDALEKIINDYVFIEDKEEVLKELSLDKFNNLMTKNKLKPRSIRYRLSIDDGATWLESSIFFLVSQGENRVVILTKNVTENAEYMREQNRLLQEALNEAKKANDAKTEFLTVISHQIRTQMNAIIGLSESALSESLPFNAREDIHNINAASYNLLDIIDGILDISKIESGILEKNEREYDTSQLFQNLIGLTKEKIGNKKINLITEIDPKIPRRLFGDSSKIKQILLNVLTNAVQYTNNGSITITAKGIKKKHNYDIIITIEDTGIGMKKDQLEKIFQNSEQVDYSQNMGLSIVKQLINLLNAKIVVESEYGKGSKFTLTFTQKVIDDKGIGNIDEYARGKLNKDYFNANGKTVLVVDDNKLNIKVALRFLEPYNINVQTAGSGQECIEMVKKGEKFDLILLDQMMPQLSGIETLKELKKDSNFKTPVVVLTADAIVGVKEQYLKEGFDNYLSKPIDAKELKSILEQYLK